MKIVVTGGSGNLGRWLVPELIKQGHEIVVCDIQPTRSPARFLRVDMLNLGELDWAFTGADAVIHLAAIPHPLNDSPEKVFHFNTQGMYNVLEAAVRNGVKRVIAASSDSAIGFGFATQPITPEYIPIDENHPRYPQDPYSLSKAFTEDLCAAFTRRSGIQTVCLRPCRILFPDVDQREYLDALNNPEKNRKGLWVYVDVRDVVQAFCLAVSASELPPHSICYVSAGDLLTKEETLSLLDRFHPGIPKVDRNKLSGYRSVINSGHAEELLGYKPKYSWRDYLE